jgi:hypothetical protein
MSIPHVRKQTTKDKEYAIFLEIDSGEWDYLRKRNPDASSWTNQDPVMVFRYKEDAQHEADKWNTAAVVEWQYGHTNNEPTI